MNAMAAIIVTPSANLELAERAILFGAVGTAGQRCTSTRRIIAHESIRDELVKVLVAAYAQVVIGDPANPKTLMGPLINHQSVADMQAALADQQNQLVQQFADMEEALSENQSESSSLASQIAQL